jgi:tRNA-2-methylthio-N6-dimethylallyladenosine synthase
MNRGYTREYYLDRIAAIRRIIPACTISTDIITGFCGETEEQHQQTISLMESVKYNLSYMYFYSERPGTLAAKRYEDDVPEVLKKSRLNEVITLQKKHSLAHNQNMIGEIVEVLVEKFSKKSNDDLAGRDNRINMVVFPKGNAKPGDYVTVKITDCSSNVLLGKIVN